MPVERIDYMRALGLRKEDARGMATDLGVGEFLHLAARVGGADLLFALQAKTPAGAAGNGGHRPGFVDKVQIVLTIESKHGQRARVRVQAPDSVRIVKPEKVAG